MILWSSVLVVYRKIVILWLDVLLRLIRSAFAYFGPVLLWSSVFVVIMKMMILRKVFFLVPIRSAFDYLDS